jgi:hypothetical protein
MPGFMPGIHVFGSMLKTWMAGTGPTMTSEHPVRGGDGTAVQDGQRGGQPLMLAAGRIASRE